MGFTSDLNKQRLTMSQRTRMFGLVPHLLAVSKFNYLLNKVKVRHLTLFKFCQCVFIRTPAVTDDVLLPV